MNLYLNKHEYYVMAQINIILVLFNHQKFCLKHRSENKLENKHLVFYTLTGLTRQLYNFKKILRGTQPNP